MPNEPTIELDLLGGPEPPAGPELIPVEPMPAVPAAEPAAQPVIPPTTPQPSVVDGLTPDDRALLPYAQIIKENPELMKRILFEGLQEKPRAPEPLVPPRMPERPAAYDPTAAATDPDSASYKYQRAMEQYQVDMGTYFQKRDEAYQQKIAQMEEQTRRQQQEAQRQMYARTQLRQLGFSPQEQEEFIAMFSDPNAITFNTLAGYFRYTKSAHKGPAAPVPPAPPGAQGGEPPPQEVTEEQGFNMALLHNKRRA